VKPSSLRPIPARLLKSAIDSLRPWIPGSLAVDLFAGRGRVGVSLLKEGARRVVFVESHRPTAKLLETAILNFQNAEIATQDAFSYLEQALIKGYLFNILFADPPFKEWSKTFSKELFEKVAMVSAPSSIFLVKHPTQMVPFSVFFTAWKTVTVGDSTLSFYRFGDM